MKIGMESTLELSGTPLKEDDEKSVVLAYAYYLAGQDYLKDSILNKISRFIRIKKPKRVNIIAKNSYVLKIIPFSEKEVLIADSCSTGTIKFDSLGFDTKSLTKSSDSLQIAAEKINDQTMFFSQLQSLLKQTKTIKRNKHSSPFLSNTNSLVREIIKIAPNLDIPKNISPIIPPLNSWAQHPEVFSKELILFLLNSDSYDHCLENVKQRVTHCCLEMIESINNKYSQERSDNIEKIKRGWKTKKIAIDNKKISSPIDALIQQMNDEVKPDIDAVQIAIENRIGGIEQKYKLDTNDIKQRFNLEIKNLREDKKLSLDVLESKEKSLRRQSKLISDEYNTAIDNYEDIIDYYESLEIDTYSTTDQIQTVGTYRRNRDDLKQKLSNVEQEKRNINMDYKNTEFRFNERITNIEKGLQDAIIENESKRDMEINQAFEEGHRKIESITAHISAIKQEKKIIEDLVKSNVDESNNLIKHHIISKEKLWHNNEITLLKIDTIKNLENKISKEINNTLKTIDQTKKFLKSHIITTKNKTSVIKELLIPYWYIELESGSKDKPKKEVYIISPSEIAKHPEGKEKTVFSIAIIPKFPSLTSTLDSIKNYRNVQQGAQESNIIQKLTPNEYLPSDHWIMKQELISQNMFNFIHKEHKKII